jgi:Leucine-rich repeat (LRR) protein
MDLSSDILEPPKTFRFLDLSGNFLTEIPQTAQYGQLRGLNINENAFVDWPQIFASAILSELQVLSIAGNRIGSPPNGPLTLESLRFLDCSNTQIRAPSGWLSDCEQLQVLRFISAPGTTTFPRQFLTLLGNLKIADLTGIDVLGGPLAYAPGLALLIRLGGGPNEAEPGSAIVVT